MLLNKGDEMETPKKKRRSRMFDGTKIHINFNRIQLIRHLKQIEYKLLKCREKDKDK